tara:strand:+ start:354 stop:560 length:207 start_codon:yes stop_codon:yes gene_type:complete
VDKIISALLARQHELATRALQHPKRDLFDHGIEAGMYSGLQAALDIIEEIGEGSSPAKAAPARLAVYG